MTKAELIAALEQFPDDTKICIQDWGLGTLDAGDTFDSFDIKEGKRVPYFVIRSTNFATYEKSLVEKFLAENKTN